LQLSLPEHPPEEQRRRTLPGNSLADPADDSDDESGSITRDRTLMSAELDRRRFAISAAAAVVAAGSTQAMTAPEADVPEEPKRDYPAPTFTPKFAKPLLGLTLIRDFVLFAHYDLAMVKKLHEKEPAILNATVDWGGGDFECALGGASHLGKREIAEYLLDHGARMDIFCATMLGLTDVVKGMIAAQPKLAQAKGPHGIPLLMHAKFGGKEAEATFAYLSELAGKK